MNHNSNDGTGSRGKVHAERRMFGANPLCTNTTQTTPELPAMSMAVSDRVKEDKVKNQGGTVQNFAPLNRLY